MHIPTRLNLDLLLYMEAKVCALTILDDVNRANEGRCGGRPGLVSNYHKHHGAMRSSGRRIPIHSLRRAGSELPVSSSGKWLLPPSQPCVTSGARTSCRSRSRRCRVAFTQCIPLRRSRSSLETKPRTENLYVSLRRECRSTARLGHEPQIVRTSDLRSISSIFSYSVQDLTAAPGCI